MPPAADNRVLQEIPYDETHYPCRPSLFADAPIADEPSARRRAFRLCRRGDERAAAASAPASTPAQPEAAVPSAATAVPAAADTTAAPSASPATADAPAAAPFPHLSPRIAGAHQ
ncbi:hypothetical protein H2136_16130 [Aeromonas hydrophila]|uniref:Uncharacterized protein n=1 Tax=Aeromonas hydrophila TaxID=644 RepID=A0A926FKE5_AERHY|nr:hypothetical protein [Aeromonas hydrophila]